MLPKNLRDLSERENGDKRPELERLAAQALAYGQVGYEWHIKGVWTDGMTAGELKVYAKIGRTFNGRELYDREEMIGTFDTRQEASQAIVKVCGAHIRERV